MARNQDRVRVEVELTAEQVVEIDAAVHAGQFRSRADAIVEAVDEWNLGRQIPFSDEELGRLWDEGIASGEPLSAEDVFERLRERVTKRSDVG